MSKTPTQNDWETEFRYKFEGANVTISSRMMDSLVADIHKIVADARKEEKEGIARWFETGLNGEWNGEQIAKLIRVLATLKEEGK